MVEGSVADRVVTAFEKVCDAVSQLISQNHTACWIVVALGIIWLILVVVRSIVNSNREQAKYYAEKAEKEKNGAEFMNKTETARLEAEKEKTDQERLRLEFESTKKDNIAALTRYKQLEVASLQCSMGVLSHLDGREFELFVGRLLTAMNYTDVRVTQQTADYGADVIAVTPDGVRMCIQCKHFTTGSVGNSAVQEAYSAKTFYDCDQAMVITTSIFTKQAITLAEKIGVHLVDRYKLCEMMSYCIEETTETAKQVKEKNLVRVVELRNNSEGRGADNNESGSETQSAPESIPNGTRLRKGNYSIPKDVPHGKYCIRAVEGEGTVSVFADGKYIFEDMTAISYGSLGLSEIEEVSCYDNGYIHVMGNLTIDFLKK